VSELAFLDALFVGSAHTTQFSMNNPTHLRTAPTTCASADSTASRVTEARQTAGEAEAKLAKAERVVVFLAKQQVQAERVAVEAKEVVAHANNRVAEAEKEHEDAMMSPAVLRVFDLPELWALIAEHSGLVGAWRLTGVCRASRVGAREWLRTLPRLVVCGGATSGRVLTSAGWRLDLGELRWERMSDSGCARFDLFSPLSLSTLRVVIVERCCCVVFCIQFLH
jgi:hypothetical protein